MWTRPLAGFEGGAATRAVGVAAALMLAFMAFAGDASAEPELVAPQEIFGWGSDWDYLDGSTVLAPGWARELSREGPVAEPWQRGPSPFVGRSRATQSEVEEGERRAARRARRRGRRYRPSAFSGTRFIYDSDAHPELDMGEETYEPGPHVVYFARTFEVADPEAVVSLFLEARFSGGFIAYLNGREWLRHNVEPASPPDAPADIVWLPHWVAQTVGNVWQRAYLGLDPELLVAGENTLAVEVRRRGSGGRRALYFDAQMRSYREHGFIRTPYLQRVTQDSITVMWETTAPAVGYVEYGSGDWLERVATSPRQASTLQQVTLTGLEPDTRYFYRAHSVGLGVGSEGEPETVTSPINHFQTAVHRGQPFNFLLYGDNRTNTAIHRRVVQEMLQAAVANQARFFLNTGDLTTHASWWDQWQEEFFEPALPMMSHFPLYAVLGNHEGNHETWYEYLEHPGNQAWYSFEYGDAEFFGINSSTRHDPESPQYEWLDEALGRSTATWKIAFLHHPPFSCVPSRKPGSRTVSEYLVPLFEQHGVNLVLLGHDHLYGRSRPINGVVYVISGGGGASTYPAEPDEINEICVRVHHYCILRLTETSLELEAISIEGEHIDHFVLEP